MLAALEKGLRTRLAALAVGEQAGLDDRALADLFQGALLQALGCTAYASEKAQLFDDDLAFDRGVHAFDPTDPGSFATFAAWLLGARPARCGRASRPSHRPRAGPRSPRRARPPACSGVMHALREERPHRPAHDLCAAAGMLAQEAARGRLDREAVAAVTEAAAAPRPRTTWPAELTDHEVDVLRLAARGLANKEIAIALGVSARTGQHHLAHIYDKTGRRTRAGAGLFAMEHSLMDLGAA